MGVRFRDLFIGMLLVTVAGQALGDRPWKRVAYEQRWYSEDEIRALLGPTNSGYRNAFAKVWTYVYAPDVPVAPGAGYHYSAVEAQGAGSDLFTQREKVERYPQVVDKMCADAIVEALVSVRAGALVQAEKKRKIYGRAIIVGIQSNEFKSAPDDLDPTGSPPVNARSLPGSGTKRLLCNVYKSERNGGTYSFSTVLTASGVYLEPR